MESEAGIRFGASIPAGSQGIAGPGRTLHNSLFTLFRVATLEDWTDVMYINIHGCGETNYGYPEKADVNNSNPLTGR